MKILHDFDQEEEQEIKELQDECRRLHIPLAPIVRFEMKTRSLEGEEIVYRDRSHSWTRNQFNFFTCMFFGIPQGFFYTVVGGVYGDGGLVTKRGDGVLQGTTDTDTMVAKFPEDFYYGLVNTDTNGILIGTGTAAESFDDYSLTQIEHNADGLAGTMMHGAQTYLQSWDAVNKCPITTFERVFANISASTITVGEVGLSGDHYYTLCSREKVDPAIDVVSPGELTVTYTIAMPYPV